MPIAAEESDDSLRCVYRNPVTITVEVWRTYHRSHRNVTHFPDPPKNGLHLVPFDCELVFVIDVLITATTTATEIGALRLSSMRGCFANLDQFRLSEPLLLVYDLGRDKLPIDRKWNENGFPMIPGNAVPAESNVFDFEIGNSQVTMLAR